MARFRCSAVVIVGLVGCAGGVPSNKGPAATSVGSTAASSVGEGTADGESSSASTIGEGESDAQESSSSGAIAESSSEGGDESSSSGADESTGAPPGCPQLASCPTATVLGMVSGDETSDAIQTQGSAPTWVAFQVTEDNDDIGGEAVSFTAILDSPGGSDFDLFVYRGASGGASGCGGVLEQSTSAGPQDVVHMSWGEGGVANGGDDRAWIAIEVVAKDECDGIAQWTLTIEGDT